MEVFDKEMLKHLVETFSIPDVTVIFVGDVGKEFKWNAVLKVWERQNETNNTKTA